ncbi:acyl-CoA N-acyltransferase [Schizopora paradoxa]|uniref:histone acetyltransferase n=1 Tax=Schizopora paradoxa TaxID=27342 RepID=A0A0H2SSD1_9AGAM|nr:acyl-CoA N-acyltransferase [Schizopora paradoxa]
MWKPLHTLTEILPEQPASTASAIKGKKRRRVDGASTLKSATPTGSSRQSASVGPAREASRSVDGQQGEGSASASAAGGRRGNKTKDTYAQEDLDTREQKKVTSTRNFDNVNFGQWQIKTWYYSPYPFSFTEEEELASTQSSNKLPPTKLHNVNRSSLRAHGRTSDLLAGGVMRDVMQGEKAVLWVCDRCFKYMREGGSYELHSRNCHATHPPGRKVYQRGAHIIWEVDGAKEKLFCQNLSLFGKLFIDIKTLFFDCENFLFYLLTDGDSQRDHVLGFFSKEKYSYDDYNLNCIVTFPPYQRKRYGMLMIEFSYELSRRAGKFGTPERPLSELGLRSYLTYWITVLVHFFRRILSVDPAELSSTTPDDDLLRFVSESLKANGRPAHKRKKSVGWDGEAEASLHNKDVIASTSGDNDRVRRSQRFLRTSVNPNGSATTNVFAQCTLEDISKATSLRIEDVAFALHECGMLKRVRTLNEDGTEDGGVQEIIVISREMVEAVATERALKRLVMEVQCVLL